tara:strand:+ start:284 stop:403 length:120 start_codon:yes stop_codon:yes gene_type:complete
MAKSCMVCVLGVVVEDSEIGMQSFDADSANSERVECAAN